MDMTRLQLLKIVNTTLLVSFLAQVITSLFLVFELDLLPGGMTAETHKYNGLFFILLVFVHIGLNWNWIKANFLAKIRR
jgi:hypothetical protein